MSTSVTTLSTMIEAIAGVVGKENAITDSSTLKKYSSDTSLMTSRMPDMVVKVKNTAQVQGVIKIANENNYPVVPRSSGTGTYGTGIPKEGGLILDLSGMKRIPRTDTRNRWALIEPGVTFGELKDELCQKRHAGTEYAAPAQGQIGHHQRARTGAGAYR